MKLNKIIESTIHEFLNEDSIDLIKNNNSINLFGDRIKGRFLDTQQATELQKEIESNYHTDATSLFDKNKHDIRQSIFNFDNPYLEKNINGKTVKIVDGLIRDKKPTYLLYADDEIIGEFYSIDDIKKIIKHIENNLIKTLDGDKLKELN